MRYLSYVALLTVLMLPLAYSQAQVEAGVSVGGNPGDADQCYDQSYTDPGYVTAPPPVCPYGYYSYYPYACTPYGFYGPQWFVGGVFIGAGPWYHWGYGGYWGHGGYGYVRGGYGRGYVGGYGRGYARGYASGNYGHGSAGNYARGGSARGYPGGNSFHGGGAVRSGGGRGYHGGGGGGGFHGGGGSHGGGHR